MSVVMIKVDDDSGKSWNINLNYVEVVEFPSSVPGLTNNLQVEKIVMQGGEVIPLPLGTWNAAIATLLVEFNTAQRKVAKEIFISGAP